MFASPRSFPQRLAFFGLIVLAGVVLVSCGPSQNPAEQGSPFDRAKAAFKSGKLDRAVDLTEKLATANPPVDTTDRARVLRAVIFTGQLKGTKAVAEAYSEGADKAKDTQTRTGDRRMQHDIFVTAGKAALNLAQTALQIAPNGAIPKELTLEASYPDIEGPTEIKELATLEKGDTIEADQQAKLLPDALRKGVDDALAEMVGGDRAKAKQALASGSTKLGGAAFAIFLAKEIADGAEVFDKDHSLDPDRFKIMCDEGEASLKAASALLKDSPDKDQEKQIKKLQDKFKDLRKSMT